LFYYLEKLFVVYIIIADDNDSFDKFSKVYDWCGGVFTLKSRRWSISVITWSYYHWHYSFHICTDLDKLFQSNIKDFFLNTFNFNNRFSLESEWLKLRSNRIQIVFVDKSNRSKILCSVSFSNAQWTAKYASIFESFSIAFSRNLRVSGNIYESV